MRQIYFALAHSISIYCIEIYANVSKTDLNQLVVKCNRLLRLMQSKPLRTRVMELYLTFDTLPVDRLFQYYTLKLLHKCIYSHFSLSYSIRRWFTQVGTIHAYSTRRKDFLFVNSNLNSKSMCTMDP